MRLIDADALIKRLNEIGAPYRADINNAIAEAPTADAVEVVRCKDCYWYDKGKNDCDSWEWCKRHKFDSYDEGFCSWATHKKQVTSKLKKPCDSLLTEDSEERKEQKSKLDLISRQDAIEAVRLESAKHLLLGRGDILDILEEIPTVDAVEVVRCRDCVYWKHRAKRNGYEWGACLFIEELEDAEHWTEDADFCSYGERSEE